MHKIEAPKALRNVLLWQQRVLQDPERIMAQLEYDPHGIAIALFSGPIWEAAHKALRGTDLEIKS
jgi:hypothetical protein